MENEFGQRVVPLNVINHYVIFPCITQIATKKNTQIAIRQNTQIAILQKSHSQERARKRTKTATTPKKKSSLTADDNIISEDPDAALELAKSISKTKVEEQEAARLMHETHERLVTEKYTGTRKQTERLAADTKKAIKANKLAIGPQKTAGSSEGSGLIPKVPDEPKVDSAATNVLEESWVNDSDTKKSDEEEVPWIYSDDDEEDDNDNDQSIDIIEMDDDERTKLDNEDQAMDDAKKNDEDKESVDAEITSMVDVQIQQEISSVLLAPLLNMHASVVPPTPTTPTPPPIPITTTEAPTSISINPKSETLSTLQLRVSYLEKEVKELKQAVLSTTLRASISSEVPSAVNEYLGSSLGDALQKELQKHIEELIQEYS
ncbi:hypothetical protein Tco_0604249 [Tanacetum coccineum]